MISKLLFQIEPLFFNHKRAHNIDNWKVNNKKNFFYCCLQVSCCPWGNRSRLCAVARETGLKNEPPGSQQQGAPVFSPTGYTPSEFLNESKREKRQKVLSPFIQRANMANCDEGFASSKGRGWGHFLQISRPPSNSPFCLQSPQPSPKDQSTKHQSCFSWQDE